MVPSLASTDATDATYKRVSTISMFLKIAANLLLLLLLPHLRSLRSKGEPLPTTATVGRYPAESAGTMELEDAKTPEAAPLVKSVRIKLDAVAGDPKSSPNGSGSTKMTSPPSWTDSGRSYNSLLSNGSSAGGSSGGAAPGLRDNLMRRQRKDRNPMA